MFLTHFNMSAHPFTENPPIEWLLTDSRFEQALARMKFFLEQGRLALITGQTGVGKSSLLRMVRQAMPHNRYTPVYLHLTSVTPGAFLRLIVTQLGEAPRFGKDRLFIQIVDRIKKNDTETVFIIDEAHLIPIQTLVDLRLLISTGFDADLPLKIILSGQELLATLLKRTSLADLVNRINIRYHIKPLSRDQTVAYIDHRLRKADTADKLITSDAKSLIHDYAGGVPRQINNIATACLINAASQKINCIDENVVNETMAEFQLP
jgi:general secretion pathway protein A